MAAAAATKQYTAIFAIGGKMLASFKGVMSAANTRLEKLRVSMLAFGKSITKVTASLVGLGTAVAGFGIGAILKSVFSGASEAAKEARQRINATIASMMAFRDIQQKGGYDAAKKELDIIYKHNEALGKQGVLHKSIYNEMTKVLSAMGVPNRQIKAAMGPMGDLLVKWRGVNATTADAAELATKYARAIHGKTKGMTAFGMFIDPNKVNAAGKKVQKSYQEIYEEILKIMEAPGTAGFNIARALDPEGRIQVLQNHLEDIREEIGDKLLPLRAKMADAINAMLTPKNVELMVNALGWLYQKLSDLVDYIKNQVVPWFQSDEGQKWLKSLGDWAVWVVQNWKPIGATILGVVAALWAFQAVTTALNLVVVLANPISLIVIGLLALAVAIYLVITRWKEFTTGIWVMWKAATRIPIIGGFIESMGQQLAFVRDTITMVWDLIVSNKEKIIDVFKTMGKIVIDWLLQPFKDIQSAYDKLINAWKNRPTWLGGTGGAGGAAAAQAAVAATAAPTAAAQKAAAQMPLSPQGLQAVQAERASVIADMQRPELRNLISATLATEAKGAEDQKNVLESLTNRLVAQKQAGTYKGVEAAIKGGFYGPYKRGETAAVMSKGLSDERYQQVGGMIEEIAKGRNALGGLTDQGMINEIHGAIKEQHGEDFYGLQGLAGETQTAAYRYSRGYQRGGIARTPQIATLAERGPEAVLPMGNLSKFFESADVVSPAIRAASDTIKKAYDEAADQTARGGGFGGGIASLSRAAPFHGGIPPRLHTTNVSFAPNITINGNASESEQASLEAKLRNVAREFIDNFKRAQQQERRLSYESGYG